MFVDLRNTVARRMRKGCCGNNAVEYLIIEAPGSVIHPIWPAARSWPRFRNFERSTQKVVEEHLQQTHIYHIACDFFTFFSFSQNLAESTLREPHNIIIMADEVYEGAIGIDLGEFSDPALTRVRAR